MSQQFWKYTLVGGMAFLADTGSLYILTEFCHLYYLLSASIAFSLGLIINYTLCICWIFKQHTYRSSAVEFFLFAIIGMVGLGCNEVFVWFFTEQVACYYIISKMISAVLVFSGNYYLRKTILF